MSNSVKITDFKPDPNNANKGTERGLRLLDDSLEQVGLGRSIVVDKNGIVIAGNKTQERAADRGFEEAIVVKTRGDKLVVVQREDLDLMDNDPNNPARRLAYLDNRASELLEWDVEQVLADVQAGMDLSDMFRDDELGAMLGEFNQPKNPADDLGARIDQAAELQEKWQVEPGDVWEIKSASGKGCHRVMCGDSANAEDVARLMDGEIHLVIIDPPYGVSYNRDNDSKQTVKARSHKLMRRTGLISTRDIIGDDDTFAAGKILNSLKNIPVCDNWIGYIFCSEPILFGLGDIFRALNFHQLLVWAKDCPTPSMRRYRYQHELIAIVGAGRIVIGASDKNRWYGAKHQTTLLEYPSIQSASSRDELGVSWFKDNSKLTLHPTQKPIALISKLITNSSAMKERVYDPCFGSGTTLLACEQTGRIGYGMEIAPDYVAVTLQRLSDMGLALKKL